MYNPQRPLAATETMNHVRHTNHRAIILFALTLLLVILTGCDNSGRPATATSNASTATRDAGDVASDPQISVSPESGRGGTYINVQGSGWASNDTVLLKLRDAQGTGSVLAATPVDVDGGFSTGFIYPVGNRWISSASYTIVAQSQGGEIEVTAPFTRTDSDGEIAESSSTAEAPSKEAAQATAEPVAQNRDGGGGTPVGPYVQLRPNNGGAETRVTVRGGGFPADVKVNIFLSGLVRTSGGGDTGGDTAADAGNRPHVYANAVSNGTGDFEVAFTMPRTWPDGTEIETGPLSLLAATVDFEITATARFDYVTTAASTATSPPTSTATHTRTHTPVPTNRPTATPTFTQTPTNTAVPTRTPTALPTSLAYPVANANPSAGTANTEIAIEGGGYPANTQLYLVLGTFDRQIGDGNLLQFATAVSDAAGNFRMHFVMPATWPDGTIIESGKILLIVTTNTFEEQSSAIFDYTEPATAPTPAARPYAEIAPDRGDADTAVTVRGGGFPGNVVVNVHLAGLIRANSATTNQPAVYASAITNDVGNFQIVFTMPRTWPSGAAIEAGKLSVLVATEDFATRATTVFDYLIFESVTTPTPTPSLWRGEYFNNQTLSGSPALVRNEAKIEFFWGTGSPDPRLLNADHFSVRWTTRAYFAANVYRFSALTDDGVRVWVDDQLLIDQWQDNRAVTYTTDAFVDEGEHTVRVEYYENTLGAQIRVGWEAVGRDVPTATWTPEVAQPSPTPTSVLFNDDPRNNVRRENAYFCSGFVTECNFGNCPRDYRLMWGPFCRGTDYGYIKPGLYEVTIVGSGRVRMGATDYGTSGELYSFGQYEADLPARYRFCWPGKQDGGYGFETVVQSLDTRATIDRVKIEYLGESCGL